ncbi:MAG: lysine-specific demethylase 5C-like, partial [Trebouxia sp. A1-2]
MPSVTGTVQHSDLFVPPEAPVFRPTFEEFEHPLRYIASIRPTAEAYGICKVIPPAGWKPPYVIDRATFRFKTRIQSVHELQNRPDTQEAADLFQEEFEAFLQSTGRPVKKAPVFGGTPIDLSRLYKAVLRRGGYELVTQNKSWRDVGRILQLEDKSNNAAYTLRQVYQKHLLAFEEYDREREDSADASQGPPGHAGLATTKRFSEPRDDAEEAADILNAIMGLSSFPQEQAPPRKRAKSLGVTAAIFKKNFFGGQAAAKKASLEAIEAEFWKVVEEAEDPVEVLYGADIDTTITGSGFPIKGSSNSPYAEHGWNLNNLPKLDGTYGSMLRHIEESIPGVVVPWMYIGMMFSSFCWHIEDHMFYSINYHHWGDAKKWYGVPGSAGHIFEEAFRKALPGHFERQPDLLFHLTTLLSPRILHQYDVPVYSATQHEGEFVITFPNAYHGGFNMGFNCAEAVNFAPADWFRFGSAGTERFRTFRKPSVVSHEGLLLKVAETDDSPETCFWAKQDLQRVIAEERQWRCKLWSTGVKRSRRTDALKGFHKDDKDEAECAICHLYLHVSGLECDCCPGRRVCLHHADNLCECDPTRWRLVYRYSLEDLDRVLQRVCSHIPGEGSDIQGTGSYLGVTPVALTNADATANEATQGAPITGPGLAGPSPPSTHLPPAPSLKTEAAPAPEQVTSFASSSAQQSDSLANGIVKMEEANRVSVSGDESEQNGRGRKRRRRGKDKKAVQPVRSYPTRERAKAEAEVEAEAEVLDAFSALAELADLAEANPEQSEQSNDPEPSKKRHKPSSIADGASEAPSSRNHQSADKADGPGTSASHMTSLMSESQSLREELERQCQQWSQQLQQQRASWSLRCDHILKQGGVK